MSEQSTNLRRNKTLTVIALLALIILGMIIGAFAVANGGPSVTFPEGNAVPQSLEIAAQLAGVAL